MARTTASRERADRTGRQTRCLARLRLDEDTMLAMQTQKMSSCRGWRRLWKRRSSPSTIQQAEEIVAARLCAVRPDARSLGTTLKGKAIFAGVPMRWPCTAIEEQSYTTMISRRWKGE